MADLARLNPWNTPYVATERMLLDTTLSFFVNHTVLIFCFTQSMAKKNKGAFTATTIHFPCYHNFLFSFEKYSVFHRFGQTKFDFGGLILSSRQFLLLPQLPQNLMLDTKTAKIGSKIIILIHQDVNSNLWNTLYQNYLLTFKTNHVCYFFDSLCIFLTIPLFWRTTLYKWTCLISFWLSLYFLNHQIVLMNHPVVVFWSQSTKMDPFSKRVKKRRVGKIVEQRRGKKLYIRIGV